MQNQFSAQLDTSEYIFGFGYLGFVTDVGHVGSLLGGAAAQSVGCALADGLISSISGV